MTGFRNRSDLCLSMRTLSRILDYLHSAGCFGILFLVIYLVFFNRVEGIDFVEFSILGWW